MGEIVAEGEVVLHARENVRAELAKAEAAFERTMAKLDGQEAELKIKADMLDFDRKAKEAQAELAKLEKQKATVTIDADTRKIDEAIAKEQAKLKKLDLANTQLENKRRDLIEKRGAAEEKWYSDVAKAEAKHAKTILDSEEKVTKARQKNIDDVTKAREGAARARIKNTFEEQAAEERAAKAAADAHAKQQKAITRGKTLEVNQRIREAVREQGVLDAASARAAKVAERDSAARDRISGQSARMERQYIDLVQKRSRLQSAKNKVFMPQSERIKVDFDIAGVNEQIAEIEAKLAMIGKPPPEIKVHLDADERGADSLNRWINAISQTTVRLGPFTTTIAGAGRALALLGPIITGVVGAIGALAGAVGSAALGFGGALTAGAAGFGLVLGSTALLMVPLMKDFKNLNTLQDAYHKQVLKTGAGSDKAKTKLKEFDHALGAVPETTRQSFLGINKLNDSFTKVSRQARPAFLNTFAEGLRTAQTGLTRFGPEMVQSFNLVAKGVRTAFRALRSPEATGILGSLFDNAQAALPAFGRGLGNLAASAGRVAAAFSRMLAPLGAGFEKWTQRFSDFTKDSSKLNKFVDGTTKSMKSLGHLLQSTGGFLASFFGAGVGPGVQLMDRMAAGIDRITNSIRANPGGLSKFFGESVDTVERLYGVLAPLASLFMEWATILRPFSNLILSVTGSIGDLVAGLAGFGPTRGLIQAAFAVFLAGSLVAKIRNVTGAIQTLAASMGALGTKQAALRASSALTGGALAPLGRGAATAARGVTAAEAGIAAGAARGGAVAAAERRTTSGVIIPAGAARNMEQTAASTAKFAGAASRGAKAAGVLKLGLTGVGAVLGIANPAFGAAALAVTGAAVAYTYFKHRNDDLKAAVKDTAAATDRSAEAYRATTGTMADTNSAYERSGLVLRQAERDLKRAKKGTDDYRLAQLNLRDAQRARSTNAGLLMNQQRESIRLSDEQVDRSKKELSAFDALHGKRMKQIDYDIKRDKDMYGALSINSQFEQRELKKLQATRDRLAAQAVAAENRQAAASINNARALKGFMPVLGQAEQQLGAYARQAGKAAATKIGVKFQDSGDAGRVAAAAGRAIKNGVPKSVATRVAVSTGDAETAIKRINAAKLTPKRLSIVESGGRKAIAMVEQLTGAKVPKKDVKIIESGGAKALAKLGELLGFKLPPKVQNTSENGAAAVISKMAAINGIKLTDKQVKAILNDLASGKAHSIAGAIAAIPGSKTSTITTIYRDIHTSDRVPGKGHFAQGGVFAAARGAGKILESSARLAGDSFSSPALSRTINAAFQTARNARKSAGEIVRKPQFLVGEQGGHPEYVIATNPAFRKRNKRLLASAANRLGMGVTAAAAGFGPEMGTLGSAGYTPDFGIPKGPKSPGKAPKTKKGLVKNYSAKGNKKALRSGRAWATYVNNLMTQQTDIEREVSIRESQVEEPEELLVETGRITGKDPATGKVIDLGPQMGPNTPQIDAYRSQLKAVMDAMAALINVIQTIITAIPQALAAIDIEDMYRKTNIHNLNDAISHEKSVIANHSKGKQSAKDKETVSSYKKKLATDEDRLDVQKKARDQIKDDRTSLTDNYKEAGFDLREANIAKASVAADYNGIQGKASADAADQNKSTLGDGTGSGGSGGGSGGGDTGPTLAQQTGLADTERANILKTFGGNAAALTSAGAANFAMGGAQRNAGALSPNSGAGMIDPQASSTGAMTGAGGSTASAIAGGAAGAKVLGAAAVGGAVAAGALTGAGGGTTNNITNNFAAPPPDAHTWTKGLEFEVGAIL